MEITSFKDIYDLEALKKDNEANFGRPYQQCTISVMDTIADPNISFDENGVCNYYHDFLKASNSNEVDTQTKQTKLRNIVNEIKTKKNGKYDCILGLSGGVDSSYLCHIMKELELNPLVVHFDYGWNLELAVKNIEQITKKLNFDLYTYVMDWNEFKDLQRAYFKSSVLDLDVPADHMIFGALIKTASKFKIKHVISGKNVETEFVLPKEWNYRKFDKVNLLNIHKKFGERSLKKLPAFGFFDRMKYFSFEGIKIVELLDYMEYNKENATNLIIEEYGWKPYGGKHFENIFTRFYQGYILLKKYNIDKRKAHLSNLIFAEQLSKEEAIEELSKAPYPIRQIVEDYEFVSKKLGFTLGEFGNLLEQENIEHEFYGTDEIMVKRYQLFSRIMQPFIKVLKKVIK